MAIQSTSFSNPSTFNILERTTKVHYSSQEKKQLIQNIKDIAKGTGIIQKEAYNEKILTAVQSPCYSRLKADLRKILGKMSNDERKVLLNEALNLDFKEGNKILGNKCVHLMSVEQLRLLAQSVSKDFSNIITTAKQFHALDQAIKKNNIQETRVHLIKNSKKCALFRLISNFIHTIRVTLNILDLGKEPNSYFETKYLLDIYWRLLEIPFKIVRFIFYTIVNPVISLSVIVIGSAVSALGAFILKKCFKKCPDRLPYCENLINRVKEGKLSLAIERAKEMDEILQHLAANNELGRKQLLIIGDKGVGKTTLTAAMAWRFAIGNVPPALKGKKLFYVNSAELTRQATGFSLKDPLEQIRDALHPHEKKAILIFDQPEFLSDVLRGRLQSLLDTSPNSFYYAIGITTPNSFKEKIESTDLERRFVKFLLNEPTKEETLSILRQMNRQVAADIRVSEKALDAIYTISNAQIKNRFQPDKSVLILSSTLQKIRRKLNEGTYEPKLHECMQTKETLSSKLVSEKLHGASIVSPEIKEIITHLEETNQAIEEIKQNIQENQKVANHYETLKSWYSWHEDWLYKTSEKIAKDDRKGKKVPEIEEKMYLFNTFIFNPELDAFLTRFSMEKLKIEIDESLIQSVVNELVQNEKIQQGTFG